MKHIKLFENFLDPMGSWEPEKNDNKKEYKNFGFLDSDILSTFIIDGKSAKLYLFNYGNYGKIRNYLNSISKDDFEQIEDWLSDRFREEEIVTNIDDYWIESIKTINKKDITDTDILSEYKDGEIGDDVIIININL